ncbi:MAG TPA: hypothetical protein VFP80_01475 [Thermoanaerobaculia bacterium]|nr:hypothetical protein [Thermoanaerobaculia bacterium]
MRFVVEERHLTDTDGRPVTDMAPGAVAFHTFDADTVDDAVRLFVAKDEGEIIGNVLKFPGFQAVATVRKATGVYTLQVTPASQQYKI